MIELWGSSLGYSQNTSCKGQIRGDKEKEFSVNGMLNDNNINTIQSTEQITKIHPNP